MRKLFTSVVAAFLVGACSSVPVPTFDGQGDRDQSPETIAPVVSEQSENTVEQEPVAILTTPVAILTKDVDERTKVLFTQALEAMAASDTAVATALLLDITERKPNLAGPWVNLSILAEQQGDMESASKYLATALEKNPNNCDALAREGVEHRRAGRFDDAEASYLKCLKQNPGHTLANLNLGILYELYMGRYAEALALYHEYQLAVVEPNPKVNIWIADLERRVAAIAQR